MSGGDIRTARQARRLLRLDETASVEDLRRAFRAAVRTAHPDHGGDAAALRDVIDAHRLLADLHAARRHLSPVRVRAPAPAAAIPVQISAVQALQGGAVSVRLPDGRMGRLKLPAGLRTGDKVRLKTAAGPLIFTVRISVGPLEVRGDHLWLTVTVAQGVLSQGGRIEIDGAAGRKLVWISPQAAQRRLTRLVGQGLPARGPHAQGHLFLRLEPSLAQAETAGAETGARSLLRRFAAAWAA